MGFFFGLDVESEREELRRILKVLVWVIERMVVYLLRGMGMGRGYFIFSCGYVKFEIYIIFFSGFLDVDYGI